MTFYADSPLTRRIGEQHLAQRLQQAIEGEVLFDAFSRGRYSTDASIYQVEPIGVVTPRSEDDIAAIVAICREEGVPLLARGAGTSQCGQTVGLALVMDVSRHLNQVLTFEPDQRNVTVQPGIVLDELNTFLKPHGLFFPIDVSTASRATLGGMTGNNSCGARSTRYGLMRANVLAIDATLANGDQERFGALPPSRDDIQGSPAFRRMVRQLLDLAKREATTITDGFPKVHRRVGGYNIDALAPSGESTGHNIAQLLVGSEGTLALSRRIQLKLHPIPAQRVLGVCHFSTFYAAMDATRHLVTLDPEAVELVDHTLMKLARDIPLFRNTLDTFVRGDPDALLLVEFAGAELDQLLTQLNRLNEMLNDLGFPDALVKVTDPMEQRQVWEVRKAGLNIMMSMKGEGKPVSFIEDCAVPLEHLADYTDRLTEIFHRHGTTGTWYAHASEGCLHVRPILNMKETSDVKKMRSIAEEAFAMVREYKGSHSGEHGDGIVRSEFHRPMFGRALVEVFGKIKRTFDPDGLLNPGKIINAPKMDDRSLFRYQPDYNAQPITTAFDWSSWGGFSNATEMCNNNGACRKRDAAVMCPSYRATGAEQDSTRGRANTLRLALSGQLGPDALTSPGMAESMALCVGCKACRRECPTGVDMARMKTEYLAQQITTSGLALRDRLIAYLPRYAPIAARLARLINGATQLPAAQLLQEKLIGFSRHRTLPRWHTGTPLPHSLSPPAGDGPEVVVLFDTFTRYFEPENGHALISVLRKLGCRVQIAGDINARPLCCGRTFLSAGLIDEARTEARRLISALTPHLERGTPIIGLEPSCLLTLRDEYPALLTASLTKKLSEQSLLLEEFLARSHKQLRFDFETTASCRVAIHGHCHQKAFATLDAMTSALHLFPGIEPEFITSSCCGMAGAFGYQRETYDVSLQMAELSLLPAIRKLPDTDVIVANGTSCRTQIMHGTSRQAFHLAVLLDQRLTGH